MAEGGEKIPMKERDFEAEKLSLRILEEETNFGGAEEDDRYRDPNRSLNVIDTSNPNYKKKSKYPTWESDTLPDLKKRTKNINREVTNEKKKILKSLGIFINKGDGRESEHFYERLNLTGDEEGETNGLSFDNVKIIKREGKRFVFLYDTKNNLIEKTKSKFRRALALAKTEHEKTPADLVENILQDEVDDIPEQLTSSVLQNSLERIDEEVENIEMKILSRSNKKENVVGLTYNESREVRSIFSKNIINQDEVNELENDEDRKNYIQMKINELENTDAPYWRKKAKNEKNYEQKLLYNSIADAAELRADQIRERINEKPIHEKTLEIIKEEAKTNDLTRFERFKNWSKQNLGTLSVVGISVAGIITTIVIGARGAVKKGAQAVGKFSKALAKLAEKALPVIGGLLTLTAKLLEFGAKGISWLAKNSWVLAIAIAYILYKEYQKRKNKK